jgi:DNA-binding NarL/FixJ family response regulator
MDRRRPSRPITAVLIDDDALTRRGLSQELELAGIEVVGEADNSSDATKLVGDLRPDVILIDTRLPGRNQGIRTIEQISRLSPTSQVLVLTRTEQNQVVEAIIAGASGYILKTADPQAIVSAVQATALGEAVLSPKIAGKLLERIRELDIPIAAEGQSAADAIRAALTERELEIFTRLASGHKNHQIGNDLGLSTHTVANHVASILAKLHLDNRIQAAAHAIRAGIS